MSRDPRPIATDTDVLPAIRALGDGKPAPKPVARGRFPVGLVALALVGIAFFALLCLLDGMRL